MCKKANGKELIKIQFHHPHTMPNVKKQEESNHYEEDETKALQTEQLYVGYP